MADREVRIAILGDSRDFQRAVRDAADTSDSSFRRIRDIAAGVLTADLFRNAAQSAFQLGRDSISAASDLNESLSRSNTVFGESGDEVEAWSRTMARGFGQSQEQALSAAGTFGNLFTQLGIGSDQAADMSTAMTELASDFASFHNADISEVLNAQQAAFRGEYDALQRFVPTINAAAVEQEALRLGLANSTSEIDAQDRALAVQSLMVRGAGQAAGDFARTSDGLANKQRILSAEWQNMQTRIGQALLPVMEALVDFTTNTLLPAFDQLSAWTREHWPEIQETITNAVQAVVDFVTPIIEGLQAFWRTFGEDILRFARESWEGIRQQIEGVLNVIKGIVDVFVGIFTGDWGRAWDGVKEIVRGAWEYIQGTIDRVLAAIKLLIEGALTVLSGIWGRAWDGIKNAASAALDGVVDFMRELPGRITSALGDLGSFLTDKGSDLVGGLLDGIHDLEGDLIDWALHLPGDIIGWIGDIGEAMAGIGRDIVEGILDGVRAIARQIWELIMSFVPTPSNIRDRIGGGHTDLAAIRAEQGRPVEGQALGGPVSANRPYLVGERGAELFVPTAAGRIVPNGQLAGVGGGGVTVHNHFHGVTDADAISRRVGFETAWAIRTRRAG